jgi:hypothetical protein
MVEAMAAREVNPHISNNPRLVADGADHVVVFVVEDLNVCDRRLILKQRSQMWL